MLVFMMVTSIGALTGSPNPWLMVYAVLVASWWCALFVCFIRWDIGASSPNDNYWLYTSLKYIMAYGGAVYLVMGIRWLV